MHFSQRPRRSLSTIRIEVFLPYAPDLGFFLNLPRFLQRLNVHFSEPSPRPLPGALLNAVYLWGKRLSGNGADQAAENSFLSKTIQHLSIDISHETNPLFLIQAQILLINYLLDNARFVEARAQLSSLVSLTLTLKLHKIRSSDDILDGIQFQLIDPILKLGGNPDSVEEGERIHAFWAVYTLDQTWSAAFAACPFIVEDGSSSRAIDTPWPSAVEEASRAPSILIKNRTEICCRIQQTTFLPNYRNRDTVTRFLQERSIISPLSFSAATARAQAAALLSKAALVARAAKGRDFYLHFPCGHELRRSTAGPDALDTNPDFAAIDTQIESFILSIPSLAPPPNLSPELLRHLTITHMIARLATIQLHIKFTDDVFVCAVKALGSCKAIVNAFRGLLPSSEPDDSEIVRTDPLVLVRLRSLCGQIDCAHSQ